MVPAARRFSALPYLVALLLISLPWQLRFIIPSEFTYTFGLFHEYTTYFIYGSDLLFALTLLWWGIELSQGRRRFYVPPPLILLALVGLLASSLATIGHAPAPFLVVYKTAKLAEFVLFFFLISNRIMAVGAMAFWFCVGVMIQALLAVIQFFQQGSLGLKFLGEIFLRPDLPGVAKIALVTGPIMRAYGTLPHPNVLAGFLVIALLCSLFFLFKPEKYLAALAGAIFLPALLFTFSRHAWLGLAIALLFLLVCLRSHLTRLVRGREWLLILPALLTMLVSVSLVYPLLTTRLDLQQFPQENAIQDRWEGIATSFRLLAQNTNWLIGVGAGNFTLAASNTLEQDLYPWERQPVHNLFLLVWNEQGSLGIISLLLLLATILAAIWRKSTKQPRELCYLLTTILIALFVLSLFDHYLLDLQQGNFLFWLTLGLIVASLRPKAIKELAQPILPALSRLTGKLALAHPAITTKVAATKHATPTHPRPKKKKYRRR